MRLLEYEAKQLLAKHGAPIPSGWLIESEKHSAQLSFPLIIKAQIPIGGRGKARGVKIVSTDSEFTDTAAQMLAEPILGHQASKLLVEQVLDIKRELYLAVTIDRTSRSLVLLAHKQGGIDIEAAVRENEIASIPLLVKPNEAIQQQILEYFGLPENLRQPLAKLVSSLWETCTTEDATLVEINPLIVTYDDQLICADAKIELDDAAAFRHDWSFEQTPASTQFVVLNEQGTVGSMANGAGLAMATVDAIANAGALPANFLDVGGGTNAGDMVLAFQKLSGLPNVKAIVVNIFGGITRCNDVADAIVTARRSVPNLPKLFIRLTGTNEAEGREILERAGVPLLPDLRSCVAAAVQEVA